MDILRAATRSAFEKKAGEITVLDLDGKTSICSYFLLCNGSTSRQVKAIADHIVQSLSKVGQRPLGVEGGGSGKWLLLDFGDLVVHIFEGPMRGYYDIDGLWLDAPRISLDSLGISESSDESVGATQS